MVDPIRILNVGGRKRRENVWATFIAGTSISGRSIVARELPGRIGRRRKPGMTISRELRNGIHLPGHARLGARERRGLAFHRPGQADAERLLRELQRPHARRVAQRDDVLRSQPRQSQDRRVGRRLQPPPASLGPGLSDPGRFRGQPSPQHVAGFRNPDQLRRPHVATPAPHGVKTIRNSNRCRMKVRWQVRPYRQYVEDSYPAGRVTRGNYGDRFAPASERQNGDFGRPLF